MRNEGNILDQLHDQVEARFGSKHSNEYFCMVNHSVEITNDVTLSSTRQNIEDNRLTNCFCAPYQMVDSVMPTTLSIRYAFILAAWVCKRQILYEDYETWIYESEEAYHMKLKEQLREFEKASLQYDETRNWKQEFDALYHLTQKIITYFHKPEKASESFGERELQEARKMLEVMCILLPQQSCVYPVYLYPSNWRSSLQTSFTQMDLLPSLSNELYLLLKLSSLREHQIKQLLFYKEDIPEVRHYQNSRQSFIAQVIKSIPFPCDAHDQQILCQMCISIAMPNTLCAAFYHALNARLHKKQDIVLLSKFFINMEEFRDTYDEAYQNMRKMNVEDMLLKDILNELNHLDEHHRKQCYNVEAANRKSLLKQNEEDEMLPQKIPNEYEAVVLQSTIAEFAKTQLYCEKGVGVGLSALFGNAIPMGINETQLDNVTLTLGCLVTQVEIERPWFKDDVFAFSSSYLRLCNARVSHGGKTLKNKKHDLLPSYPKRMVLMKDVTLRFDFRKARSMLKIMKQHAAHGNGFLCFHNGRKTEDVIIDQNGDILTLRYPRAELLGYFMYYTPKDESRKAQGG